MTDELKAEAARIMDRAMAAAQPDPHRRNPEPHPLQCTVTLELTCPAGVSLTDFAAVIAKVNAALTYHFEPGTHDSRLYALLEERDRLIRERDEARALLKEIQGDLDHCDLFAILHSANPDDKAIRGKAITYRLTLDTLLQVIEAAQKLEASLNDRDIPSYGAVCELRAALARWRSPGREDLRR